MRDFAFAALLCFLYLSVFRVAETRLLKETEPDADNNRNMDDKCGGMFCHAGQECVVSEDGNTLCVCISSCPKHSTNSVCGSDGMSYDSHCQLHRTACLEGRSISIKNDGLCQEPPTSSVVKEGKVNMSKPVVCYEQNRDHMRSQLIEWLRPEDETAESGHENLVRKYFDSMDNNKDGTLDTNEFTELIKSNQSISEVLDPSADLHPILQSLCTEALISICDGDSDWKLNFDEFATCLDPTFKPSGRGCELENKVYPDGAEIPTDCNSCVCSCGHWVCTVMKCTDEAENPNEEENNKEISEAVPNKTQFVVEGSQVKNKLMQGTSQQNQGGGHKGRVLPLLKTHHRHHHRNKKRKNHGDKV